MGRTYSGGVLRHDVGYGATLKKVPNPYRGQILVHSVAGPLAALMAHYADYAEVSFVQNEAQGYYHDFLFRDQRLGHNDEPALVPSFAGMPNWSAQHKLSGKAAILLNGKFDKDGKRFASGWPAMGAVWQGVLTYDARQDSTYPGGSGPQRINDENTWAYSECPAQHALAYALGRFRNGKKVFGVGLPVDGIVIEHFVELSNVCQANGWKVGGIIYEPGDRWANLKRILEAGGAEPLFIGGKLGLRINAPRVSIYTLTAGDLAEDDAEIPAAKTWRERRNGIRPKFRSEANKWTYVTSDLVSIPSYISEDGEEKFEELQWDLVQEKNQVAQLAAYKLVNGREIGPITLVCKPHLRRFGPGDMITLQLGADHALGGMDAVILKRSVDPASMKVTLTLETETAGKHDFALGRTGTAPPSPALAATEDKDVIAASVIQTDTIPWTGVLDDDPAHPKPEDGATVGATPAQVSLIDQINQEAAAAAAAAAAAQAAITAAQGRIDDIEASIGNLDLDDLNEQIGAIESDLSGAQTSITNLQTQAGQIIASVGQVGTRVDQVESSVSTLGGSVSTLSQTVTNLNGTVSTLSQTVSTQGGQISTIAQSVTTLSGSLSTLTTIVAASSNPNLLPNGGFENGLRGWNNSSSASVANAWFRTANAAWGSYAVHGTAWTGQSAATYGILESDVISGLDVGSFYTVAADADIRPNGQAGAWAALQIRWATASGPIFSDITNPVALPAGGIGFSDSGATRASFKLTRQVPSGTTGLSVRLVTYAPQGVQINSIAWRQVKLERGQIATPYSGEATAGQVFTAYSDLNSSFASLSTTVSSQGGSITTLQQSFSSINGTVSALSSTVTAQGTSITSLQQVQATQSGTIATLQQRSTVGGNLLNNTEFAADASSWNVYIWDQNSAGFEWGRDLPDGNWRPNNEHMLALHQTDSNAGRFSQWFSEQVNIVGGRWYEGSAHTSSHRCYTMLRIDWYDGNGSGITSSDSNLGWSNGYPGFFQSNGGTNLGNWQRLWVKAQAPLNATRAILTMVKTGTSQDGAWAGATDSWAWFARPQLSEIYADTVMPVAYFPGRTSASFASQQTAINGLSGQYASLSSTVSTQGSSISQNATAISGLQGQQASLSSTVSTQGAAITNLQTATSTLQGNVATLTTQVTAGSPNLIRNGSFEMGNLNYWTPVGAVFNVNGGSGTWGTFAVNSANVPDGSYTYIESNSTDIERDWHTLTADIGYFINGGSGIAYLEIIWFNGSGGVLGGQGGVSRPASFNFTSDGATRRLLQVTAFPPEGTVRAAARIVWYKANGVAQSMHVRQVKLERGQVATPYSADASVTQSFQALSTLDTHYASLSSTVGVLGASVSTNASAISNLQGQYASLSSTVSTLNSTVTVQQAAINNLNGKTAAWWQVEAVSSDGRAQLRVWADAVGGGGVDIIGDLRVTGNALIGGTVNPEALALDRFVKRIYGTGTGSPNAGETRLLYAQDVGYTTANGSYLVEMTGSFQTTVGRLTTTSNGKPYYQNHLPDGGLLVRLNKNGNTIAEVYIRGEELVSTSNIGFKTVSLNRNLVFDAPGGGDSSGGNATILIYAIRGNQDTGQVDDGDTYYRNISATYSNFTVAAKTKWTFI